MTTNDYDPFESALVLTDPEEVQRFLEILYDEEAVPLSATPYTAEDEERSRKLLKQYLSRCGY